MNPKNLYWIAAGFLGMATAVYGVVFIVRNRRVIQSKADEAFDSTLGMARRAWRRTKHNVTSIKDDVVHTERDPQHQS